MLCFDQALQLVKCVTATCLKPPMIFFNRLLHTVVSDWRIGHKILKELANRLT